MGLAEYISEAEAMQVCGVTAKTLSRFAEAGYLSIEKESDGPRLYCSQELEKVFGNPTPKRKAETIHNQPKVVSIDSMRKAVKGKKMEGSKTEKNFVESTPRHSEEPKLTSAKEAHQPSLNVESESYYSATDQSKPVMVTSPSSAASVQLLNEALKEKEANDKLEAQRSSQLEAQIEKLDRINEVSEKIIELREERISDLTTERDWLRSRIEKLEEKAERDQVLLLTETQLLRQMIEQRAIQRSPVRAALEWLGVMDPQQPQFPSDSKVIDT